MRLALIGCGLVGKKRLKAFLGRGTLAFAVDPDLGRAHEMISCAGQGQATSDWKTAVHSSQTDAVIVATPHDLLGPLALEAVKAGKHVLIEKPGASTGDALEAIQAVLKEGRVCVRIGFNHRYHPAFQKAREMIDSGELGPLMFVRARYGHGGRLGYESEWRCNSKISGGGELIDQGVHLIDLARWFLGDFPVVEGHLATYYWPTAVEDNAFLSLRSSEGKTAWLHASWTEWKNLFSFEIYAQKGKLQIEGLGGSYGRQRLYCYKMLPEMGPPEILTWEYPEEDESWKLEMEAFFEDIRLGRPSAPGIEDGIAVLRIVENLYQQERLTL